MKVLLAVDGSKHAMHAVNCLIVFKFVTNDADSMPFLYLDGFSVVPNGGDITFRGFKDGIVYLNMQGSCSGCPSSTATLRHGIQNLLRHYVPEVVEVQPV